MAFPMRYLSPTAYLLQIHFSHLLPIALFPMMTASQTRQLANYPLVGAGPNIRVISTLRSGVHFIGQHLLGLLGHRLLRYLGHRTVARGMALRSGGAGVVDHVGDFLFDGLGELLLELLGHDAVAYGVGLVGSLRHCFVWFFGGLRSVLVVLLELVGGFGLWMVMRVVGLSVMRKL